MLNEAIRKHMKSAPFEPFEIEMVTGRVLKVPHPDFILLPPVPRAPYFVWIDGKGIPETLNTNLVVAVRNQSNDRKKSRRRKAG